MTTTARRRELAELARSRGSGGRSGGWRTAAIVLLALAILGAGAAWALGAFSGPREVRELRSLVEQETQRLERVARGEVAFDDGSSGFSAVFEQARAVPEPYRRAVWQDMGRLFEARESAEVQSFFRMPAAERQAELDRRIKAEEQRRQARDAARAQGGDRGPRGGGTPPGGRPSAGGPTGAVPATGAAGTAGGGGTQRGGRGWTEEDRNRRYKASIDRSTPEQRAMRTEYRRLMQERRTQLGLSNRRW